MQVDNIGIGHEMTTNSKQDFENKDVKTGQESEIDDKTLGREVSEDKVAKERLLEAIEKASGKVEVENKGLEFAIHEGTNQIIIRIINEDTHETIKELPSEKILDMVAKMVELSGMFINEKR